jgi:prophage regulatory protein
MPRLIGFKDLREIGITHGKTQLWRLVRDGQFPAPIKVGVRSAWIADEVDAWIRSRMAARDGAAAS